ncbi:MAG TPA: SDR family oxidoreductase [Bacteroidota bacterium]|nr:SDR family oxidoreductase [Bacteroidota bacterium]
MALDYKFKKTDWALILGASSGFGGAAAIELARHGMNICAVHFDRAATLPNALQVKAEVEACGVRAMFFNVNASDPAKRTEVIEALATEFESNSECNLKVLMHSLAFGTLRPLVSKDVKAQMSQAQIEMTLDVMASSLIYWTQSAFNRGLMKPGSHIYTMTSSGGRSQLPNYGAVSAAKAALESYTRQLCVELGPYGITANAIMAGVTDTAALRKIPGATKMIDVARRKNPAMRNTTPEDVARAVSLLSHDDASFISGNTIGVDGGEDVAQYIGQKDALTMD